MHVHVDGWMDGWMRCREVEGWSGIIGREEGLDVFFSFAFVCIGMPYVYGVRYGTEL